MKDLKKTLLEILRADGAEPARPLVGDEIPCHVGRETIGVDLDQFDEFRGDHLKSSAGCRDDSRTGRTHAAF
jgi:hypothetical protein